MTATHDGPQLSGSGDKPPRNKLHDARVAVLLAIIGGGAAGIAHRVMEEASYYEAMATAGGVTLGLLVVIFVVMTYIWS
ncbi:hypothetical protein [Streptomyces olindensis]|uniref:hypothetical protein n=1 Tax=Streptomyces olindensis TaxID=358823 RepID=UPI0033C65A1B